MFRFKHFVIKQELCAMKVGTDGVLLGAWANGGSSILDIGTGTGVIALMMLQRFPQSHVTAIDLDQGACRQAQENVRLANCEHKIEVVNTSIQHWGHPSHDGHFDAIVCNPPFFIDSMEAPDNQRNMARHTATLTYADLMQAAWRLLSDEGELSVVVPFDYRQRMEDEATFRGFFPSRVCAVRTVYGKPARRYLLAFKKHPCEHDFDIITIGDETYKHLTQDFYL